MIAIGSNEPASVVKKYVGFITASVVAVNPTREQLKELLGGDPQEPVYTGQNGEGAEMGRVCFWLKPEVELPGMKLVKHTVTLIRQGRKNSDGSKTQVIDKYGNTAWVTDEEFKKQEVPRYSNGRLASIIPPYQMACGGQERLFSFIKAWANVPSAFSYDKDTKEFIRKPDSALAACQCELDLKKFWKGDMSEVAALVKPLEKYKIKALLTVKPFVNDKGERRLLQSVYDKVVPAWRSYEAIEKEYQKEVAAGLNSQLTTMFVDAVEYTPDNVASTVYSVMSQPTPAPQPAYAPTQPSYAAPQPAYMPPQPVYAQEPFVDDIPF